MVLSLEWISGADQSCWCSLSVALPAPMLMWILWVHKVPGEEKGKPSKPPWKSLVWTTMSSGHCSQMILLWGREGQFFSEQHSSQSFFHPDTIRWVMVYKVTITKRIKTSVWWHLRGWWVGLCWDEGVHGDLGGEQTIAYTTALGRFSEERGNKATETAKECLRNMTDPAPNSMSVGWPQRRHGCPRAGNLAKSHWNTPWILLQWCSQEQIQTYFSACII